MRPSPLGAAGESRKVKISAALPGKDDQTPVKIGITKEETKFPKSERGVETEGNYRCVLSTTTIAIIMESDVSWPTQNRGKG